MTDDISSLYEASVEGQPALTEKQKQILLSAIEIFSQKGYATTSTNEIAKKAGVAEGTIFRHYKTKKELLLSIVTPVMTRMVAPFIINDVKKVLHKDHETFEDFLTAFFLNRVVFIRKNLPILKIMLQEIPFHEDLREQFMEHVGSKMFNTAKEVFEHYQKKGQIRSDWPSETLLRLIATTIMGYLLPCLVLMPDAGWDHELEIQHSIAFIMNGIRPN